jgi:glutathione synthase/RimK-type ligase-like ATP-grasp enzyme
MKRIKTIVVYCKSLELGGDPFENGYYWEAYQDLVVALQARGVDAYFAAGDSYVGSGMFREAYTLEEKSKDTSNLVRRENVKADMVFDRGYFEGRDVPMVNPLSMHVVGNSKVEIYKHFAKFQPFSVICNNREELQQALQQLKGEKVVVKEAEGTGGSQVYIGTRDEVNAKVQDGRFPVLAQEFMDTSIGVPGLVEGRHDFRMIMCGGELVGCYLRTPKEGEYRANVSKGGTMTYLSVNDIPAEAAEVAHEIDGQFSDGPRYYSVDMAHTPEGWRLIEVDSLLALHPMNLDKNLEYLMNKLADYLVKVCLEFAAKAEEPTEAATAAA